MKALKKIFKRKSKVQKEGHHHHHIQSSRSVNSKASESFPQITPELGDPLLTADTGTTAAASIHSQSLASKPDDITTEIDTAVSVCHSSTNGASSGPEKKMWPERPENDKLLGSTVLHPDPHATESEVETTQLEVGDSPYKAKAYDEIPLLEQTKLPRGGVSVETKAIGRVQV